MSIDLTANCVCFLKMDDDAANKIVVNTSGVINGLSVRNTNLLHTEGKVGGALAFNGTSDYIDTNDFEDVFRDSFSICLWCKANNGQIGTRYQSLFGSNGDTRKFIITIDPDGKLFGFYQSDSEQSPAGFSSDSVLFQSGINDWHFIVITVEAVSATQTRAKSYFDNVLVADGGIKNNLPMSSWSCKDNMLIGDSGNDGDPDVQWFDGLIDNVMIFNKILSTDEITFLYNNGDGTEELTDSTPSASDIEAAIYAVTAADVDLQNEISGRFYLQELPQKASLPAIVYQSITTEFNGTLANTTSLRKPSFRFVIWAATMSEVIAISEALKTCLNSLRGDYGSVRIQNARPINEGDIINFETDEELKRKGRFVEYEFYYQTLT